MVLVFDEASGSKWRPLSNDRIGVSVTMCRGPVVCAEYRRAQTSISLWRRSPLPSSVLAWAARIHACVDASKKACTDA